LGREEQLQHFVHYYNHERYHESLNNLTPADVFYGRDTEILNQREIIKFSNGLKNKLLCRNINKSENTVDREIARRKQNTTGYWAKAIMHLLS
jgi:hypothetical protein